MSTAKSAKKRAKWEAKQDARRQYDEDGREIGDGAPYTLQPDGSWMATYRDGTTEAFFRGNDGMIRGCGDRPLHYMRMLDNRPPLHANANAALQVAYDQGYFVFPTVMEVGEMPTPGMLPAPNT